MIGWWSKRPDATLGASAPSECTRLKAKALADEIAADVSSAAYPGYSPELHDALSERATAEIQAAAPLPIDPTAALADGWALERVAELKEELSRAQDRVETARTAHAATIDRLVGLKKPLGPAGWAALIAAIGVFTTIATLTIGGLLTSSADTYIFRSYLASVFQVDVERFSAGVALYLMTGCAAFLLGGQLFAIAITRGRLHWAFKLLLIICDCGIAAGFALMRLGDHFSWQAVSISVFECSLTFVYTIVLFGLASMLTRDADRVELYSPVAAEVKIRKKILARALKDATGAETRLLAQMHTIATREDAVRRADRHNALAATTATAEYAVATSKLIAEEAQNPSEEALTEGIKTHLAVAFAREGRR